MASKPAKPAPYRPRHRLAWVRRHDRRSRFPAPTVATLLLAMPTLRRDELGRIAERAIDRMDGMEPDPDLEDDGDTEDGNGAEDDGCAYFALLGDGPGCPISDAGGGNVEDEAQINEVAPYTGPLPIEKGAAI